MGLDPLTAKYAERKMPTFGELADQHIAAMAPSWRNEKHRAQWVMTLEVYAAPIRAKAADEVTTADVPWLQAITCPGQKCTNAPMIMSAMRCDISWLA